MQSALSVLACVCFAIVAYCSEFLLLAGVEVLLANSRCLRKDQQQQEEGDGEVVDVVGVMMEDIVGSLGYPIGGVLVELGIILSFPHIKCCFLYDK